MIFSQIATLLCDDNVRNKTVDALGKLAQDSGPLQAFILGLESQLLTALDVSFTSGQAYYGESLLPHTGRMRLVDEVSCHSVEDFGIIIAKPSFDPELTTTHFGVVPGIDQLEFTAQLLGVAGVLVKIVNASYLPVLKGGLTLPVGILPCSQTGSTWGILMYDQAHDGKQSTGVGVVGYKETITSINVVSGTRFPRRCFRQS